MKREEWEFKGATESASVHLELQANRQLEIPISCLLGHEFQDLRFKKLY